MRASTKFFAFAAVTAAVVLLPDLAHAQGVGGGGGAGIIDGVVQWFLTNVARGLVMLGIIAIAVFMFVQRFSPGPAHRLRTCGHGGENCWSGQLGRGLREND